MKKDKMPKALRPGGDGVKRKKWSKSKQKEKINNAVFWTKPLFDKCMKEVIPKEKYITTSIISDKLKVNMSMAREIVKELREEEQLVPFSEYHSKYCIFVKGPKYAAPEEKKEVKQEKKGGEKKEKKGKNK